MRALNVHHRRKLPSEREALLLELLCVSRFPNNRNLGLQFVRLLNVNPLYQSTTPKFSTRKSVQLSLWLYRSLLDGFCNRPERSMCSQNKRKLKSLTDYASSSWPFSLVASVLRNDRRAQIHWHLLILDELSYVLNCLCM